MQEKTREKYIIDGKVNLKDFMDVVLGKKDVDFSQNYIDRVNKSRKLIEKWVDENKIIYGVTTGFGSNSTKTIDKKDAARLQKNIIISHSTSLGELMTYLEVRATMLMILLNLGWGYSGVRIETLERYRDFLNKNLYPFAPKEGSVGYLSPEAHIAMAVVGEGEIIEDGKRESAEKVLKKYNMDKYELSYKEGLALVSGTTGVTGMAALALHKIIQATKTSDIIAAMSLEVSKATLKAFDSRVIDLKKHKEQIETAENIRKILSDSEISKKYYDYRLQDALSLRCIPQLHGAAKKTLYDAKDTIENEMNSCADNPISWYDEEKGESFPISSGNPDCAYVGVEMDSAAMAATMIAKMSERRSNRLIDSRYSGNPDFLIKNPGLNSGLMITQYTQAGLLNDMKILSTPAVVDNIPTCAGQEDYVAMGYNSAKKAVKVAENLESILAMELLSAYQSYQYLDKDIKKSKVTESVYEELGKYVKIYQEDEYLYKDIEKIKSLISSGEILKRAEEILGEIK